jgi:uncharacterized RDD family membrane protein YckC
VSASPSSPAGIVTPDAVALDLELATVGSRGIAYLVDLAILGTGLVLLGLAEAVFGFGGFVPDWAGLLLVLLLVFAWQFGYPIGFETLWRGRTPGKALLGLRVVTAEGAPVGVRHATVRAVVGLFELTGTVGVPAILTSLLSARGQRLGDLAAGTLVVRERRSGATPQAQRFAPPHGLEAYAAQLDASLLGPAEYAAVRDLLVRAPQLPPDVRHRVAAQLGAALRPRVTPAPPPGVGPEDWLRCVAAAVQARRTGVASVGPAQRVPPAGTGPVPSTGPGSVPPAGPRPDPQDGPPTPPGRGTEGGFAPPS